MNILSQKQQNINGQNKNICLAYSKTNSYQKPNKD